MANASKRLKSLVCNTQGKVAKSSKIAIGIMIAFVLIIAGLSIHAANISQKLQAQVGDFLFDGSAADETRAPGVTVIDMTGDPVESTGVGNVVEKSAAPTIYQPLGEVEEPKLPDLIVEDVFVSTINNEYYIAAKIKNIGTAPVEKGTTIETEFIIHSSNDDTEIVPTIIDFPVGPGTTTHSYVSINKFFPVPAGSTNISIVLDRNNKIAEISKKNNSYTGGKFIDIPAADLAVTKVEVDSNNYIKAVIENIGTDDADKKISAKLTITKQSDLSIVKETTIFVTNNLAKQRSITTNFGNQIISDLDPGTDYYINVGIEVEGLNEIRTDNNFNSANYTSPKEEVNLSELENNIRNISGKKETAATKAECEQYVKEEIAAREALRDYYSDRLDGAKTAEIALQISELQNYCDQAFTLPDFQIQTLGWNADQTRFKAAICNLGDKDIDAVDVDFMVLGKTDSKSVGPLKKKDKQIDCIDVESVLYKQLGITLTKGQIFDASVIADPNNKYKELDYENNKKTVSFTKTNDIDAVVVQQPDLTVKDIRQQVEAPRNYIEVKVDNIGKGIVPADAKIKISCYYGDPATGELFIGDKEFTGNIAAGSSKYYQVCNIKNSPVALRVGQNTLLAKVEMIGGSVSESDLTNNGYSKTFSLDNWDQPVNQPTAQASPTAEDIWQRGYAIIELKARALNALSKVGAARKQFESSNTNNERCVAARNELNATKELIELLSALSSKAREIGLDSKADEISERIRDLNEYLKAEVENKINETCNASTNPPASTAPVPSPSPSPIVTSPSPTTIDKDAVMQKWANQFDSWAIDIAKLREAAKNLTVTKSAFEGQIKVLEKKYTELESEFRRINVGTLTESDKANYESKSAELSLEIKGSLEFLTQAQAMEKRIKDLLNAIGNSKTEADCNKNVQEYISILQTIKTRYQQGVEYMRVNGEDNMADLFSDEVDNIEEGLNIARNMCSNFPNNLPSVSPAATAATSPSPVTSPSATAKQKWENELSIVTLKGKILDQLLVVKEKRDNFKKQTTNATKCTAINEEIAVLNKLKTLLESLKSKASQINYAVKITQLDSAISTVDNAITKSTAESAKYCGVSPLPSPTESPSPSPKASPDTKAQEDLNNVNKETENVDSELDKATKAAQDKIAELEKLLKDAQDDAAKKALEAQKTIEEAKAAAAATAKEEAAKNASAIEDLKKKLADAQNSGSSTDISKAQRELYIKQLEDLIAKYNALLTQKKQETKSYCELNPNDSLCKKSTSELEATLAKLIEKMAQKDEAEESSKETPDLSKIQMAKVAEQAASRRSRNIGITTQQISTIIERCFPNLSANEWYSKPIAQAYNNGLIECAAEKGKEFNPAEFINRAEGSKLLVCVLEGKDKCESLITQSGTYPEVFIDVSSNEWFANLVALLNQEGYLVGYATDAGREFRPNNPFTRVAVLKLMMDIYGFTPSLKAVESLPFSDISKTSWYAPYITESFSKGLIRGYVDGTFRPANAINRVEILTIIDRFDSLVIAEYEKVSENN